LTHATFTLKSIELGSVLLPDLGDESQVSTKTNLILGERRPQSHQSSSVAFPGTLEPPLKSYGRAGVHPRPPTPEAHTAHNVAEFGEGARTVTAAANYVLYDSACHTFIYDKTGSKVKVFCNQRELLANIV
jgi:hypothetical protein